MNSFTLSLPLLALIAIFASAAAQSAPKEIIVSAPPEFASIYLRAKARYKVATPSASPSTSFTSSRTAQVILHSPASRIR